LYQQALSKGTRRRKARSFSFTTLYLIKKVTEHHQEPYFAALFLPKEQVFPADPQS
jgi:hypothetical protein